MEDNVQYWDERAAKFGHTGWANPMVYAYDQLARLKAICEIVENSGIDRGTALDFGAGTGDFALALSKMFQRVVACDISTVINVARTRHTAAPNVEFIHTGSLEELPVEDKSLDLVLSVTVLQHVLSDDALLEILAGFHRRLRPTGLLIALEYTPTADEKPTNVTYQRFLTFGEWRERFERAGFSLQKHFGFYHPILQPCASYERYTRRPLLRTLMHCPPAIGKRLGGLAWVKYRAGVLARKALQAGEDYYWEGKDDDVFRVMVWKPT